MRSYREVLLQIILERPPVYRTRLIMPMHTKFNSNVLHIFYEGTGNTADSPLDTPFEKWADNIVHMRNSPVLAMRSSVIREIGDSRRVTV